ncbi:MAG: transcription-repair coupling factor [Treponema sp.]|jgi:transcription-repair coupling factor (superfamily II helicase)|nr:transcription-repair coupling factor [Treponema sp.]
MNPLSLVDTLAKSASVSALLNAYRAQTPPFGIELEGPEGSAVSMLVALLAGFPEKTGALIVVPTDREASELSGDLEAMGLSPVLFPWWGTMPYREISSLSPVFGERTRALSALLDGDRPVIVPERAFLTPLPPPGYFKDLLVPVEAGREIDTRALAALLARYGYTRVPQVQLHGEFALRGEVLDIFPGGEDEAYRILFDYDRVESIRTFDPADQAPAQTRLSSFTIRPLKEVIWTEERVMVLAENLEQCPEFSGSDIPVELEERGFVPGEELLFPLAFDARASVLDYMNPSNPVFYIDRERLQNAQQALEHEYQGLFRKAVRERKVPSPERILLAFDGLAETAAGSRGMRTVSFMGMKSGGKNRFAVSCDPARSFFGNMDYLKEEFISLLKQGWTIVVAAESDVQAERIKELLHFHDEEKAGAREGLSSVQVITSSFSAGFSLPEAKLMLVQENEIFGRRRQSPRSLHRVKSSPIDTFVELNPGDFVVHVNYGIGLFKGIERVKVLGYERDYIKLEYLNDETVFVPIEQVNLVQRYIGNEGAPPRLDKLGSKSWENRKGRVKQSVEELAQRLITLYSRRKASRGYAFSRDSEWQTLFEAAFLFEETEDQLRCVEEIKADMESAHPMDRLVCGDVGYGKTEVAVRACFKAIMDGKQAAFLAPTTILAEQHYDNFRERFSQFPVKIAMLSRFVSPGAAKKILVSVRNGEVDLLVGTQRIIQKDVSFRDLGLLVIDEEQRFGVKDKERLKELKTNVDCLTLSATPIPRTLHMSLLKIRDMSLLATPPRNRHPIETAIGEFDEEQIAVAIRAEVERGGQVFFLHNRIESLGETRLMLERIVPEMLVETAHGRMDARELEDVMRRFIHGGFHVLVSTTIIENGIDIPNVNTIIIDRADMYGVSQLYQLRGRVGRSDRVARAFLFYPAGKALSELAMKRLQVISDFTELGSGFKIAMKDMEIRGAGNLLGREQSGDIYSVGFDLYIRLLDEAVKRLENEHYETETETLLDLEYSGFIPDSYIDSPQEKMEVYKKIAGVRSREELDGLHTELLGRFGPPPDEAASLLSLAEIRVICRDIEVASLKEKSGLVRVEFSKVAKVNVDRLVRLMKESSGRVRLDPRQPNILILKTGSIGLKEKSEFIREKLAALTPA